jgi:hypothetical protein
MVACGGCVWRRRWRWGRYALGMLVMLELIDQDKIDEVGITFRAHIEA